MADLAIYGASGLGKEVLDLAQRINIDNSRWDSIRFIDDNHSINEVAGLEVLTLQDMLAQHNENNIEFVIALGEPALRESIGLKLKQFGLNLATLIHPEAQIGSRTFIEAGSVIQYGCFISCDVTIGQNSFFQPNSCVGHDSVIDENSVLSSNVCIAGHCTIGKCVYIGMNTPVMEGVTIGKNTIVGMGSVVTRDIPEGVIALGNPARPMKNNDELRVFSRN